MDQQDINRLKNKSLPIVQIYHISEKTGDWKIDHTTRFVLTTDSTSSEYTRLQEIVELVTAEYIGKDIPINKDIQGSSDNPIKMTNQDIMITLSEVVTEKSASTEAYKIIINEAGVQVIAASEQAVLYALRTIQHFMLTNKQTLTFGEIIDFPNLEERRVHIDIGRKYFTKEWIMQHIRELSYLKMNTLQLHFAENMGFRIESEFDPVIVSQDGYLKKEEVREILQEAKKYGVKIIPSLDTPGHVEHMLKFHPQYGQINIHGEKSKVALDVTNPEAIHYIKGLYSEYMDLFEGATDFHIGADEYMEFDRDPFMSEYKPVLEEYAKKTLGEQYTWKDTLASYINDIAEHVYERGFKPRIWNDGVYYGEVAKNSWEPDEPKQKIAIHNYIGIDYWSNMPWNKGIAPLSTFVHKGHKDIYNVNSGYFYYVLRNEKAEDGRKQHSFDYLNQDVRIYEEWSPGIFSGMTVEDSAPYIKGVSLAIWNDNPNLVGEDVIAKDISKELHALACKAWNSKSPTIATIEEFQKNGVQIGHVAYFEKE